MGWDNDRANEKRAEVKSLAHRHLTNILSASGAPVSVVPSVAVDAFVGAYAHVSPPETEELRMELIVMSRFGQGGRTTKPGNLRLNMGRLMNSLAAGTLTAAGAATMPWTIPLAALVIWNDFYAQATVDLTEDDGSVIWAMWLHNDHNTVADADLLSLVNEERTKAGRQPLPRSALDDVLTNLTRLRCVERSQAEPGRWCLREWVSVNYR